MDSIHLKELKCVKKERNSNLELYRIIVMLLIVAHHYVVNSNLAEVLNEQPFSIKSMFLYIFGMWGKTGINCFVMITGYFMCKSNITLQKFLKLLMEIEFYKIFIYFVFLFSGYASFSMLSFLKHLSPIGNISNGFVSCFVLFYLFIPFLNKFLQNIDKREHAILVALLIFIYTIWPTLPFFEIEFNYVTWFTILYIIASYIRFYPINKGALKKYNFWGGATMFSIFFSIASVFTARYILNWSWSYFVADSNAIFALSTAVCSFMYFKDVKIKQSFIINTIASSTFGVLLIHANSDTMRQWLWCDLFKNTKYFFSPNYALHAIFTVILVFIICVIIDQIRIRFFEKFYLDLINKLLNKSYLINELQN